MLTIMSVLTDEVYSSNEPITTLTAAIIRSALEDYCAEPPRKKKDTREYLKWERLKTEAELFFESRLFLMTNLDKDYLIRTYKKLKATNRMAYFRH